MSDEGDEAFVDRSAVVTAVGVLRDTATALAESGANAQTVQSAVAQGARAFGLDGARLMMVGRSIEVSYAPQGQIPIVERASASSLEAIDLARQQRLEGFLRELAQGPMTAEAARERLTRVLAESEPWPWWITVSGGMLLAISITLQSGGSIGAALLAAVVLLAINRLGAGLASLAFYRFYQLLVQAATIVVLGVALNALGVLSLAAAAAVMGACLVLILPVPQIVTTTADAVQGDQLTALARGASVALSISGIAAGAALITLGAEASDLTNFGGLMHVVSLPLWLAIAAAVVGSLGNVFFMSGWRGLMVPAAAAGLLAATVNQVLRQVMDLSGVVSVAIAGVVLGVFAVLLGTRLRIPASAIVAAGVAGALLPGLDVYRSIAYTLLGQEGATGYLLQALATTAAIGVGVVFGTTIATAAGRMREARQGR